MQGHEVRRFVIRPLSVVVSLAIFGQSVLAAQSVEFNTDVLDVKDRSSIDLSEFSQAGYIMPGEYNMVVYINKNALPEQTVKFLAPDNNPKGSEPCITPDMVERLGLKTSALRDVSYWHQGQCLNFDSLKGMSAQGELASASLYLNIPQAYLEYTAKDWDPPATWDDGVAGLLFDYNFNTQLTRSHRGDGTQSVSGNGTTGFNLGAWRFRADWQGNYNHNSEPGNSNNSERSWDWTRYYAYRAITALRAKLTLGESYLNSSIFDSFRYLGASLETDDNMLPPNLRGYAPEVTGVANTNAKVTISQQGRVLYETTVAAGPFRIQDLNSATTGTLDVKITEEDGSVRTYQVNTANIPYLTRPGLVRYKLALGRPLDYQHNQQGPGFVTGEFSWGINNGWSLYGGSVLAGSDYNALALGIGRDLMAFGALSFDITQSTAELPQQGVKSGGSYRLSYSKRFDQYDSQVTFAGYRFSQRDFMSMSQYLDARYLGQSDGMGRELYTITLNKQFSELNLSTNLNYSHQTYWDRPSEDSYTLSLARYFDLGRIKNISLSLSAYRSAYNNTNDDGMYVSLSVPWGTHGTLTYDSQHSSSGNTNMVGYSGIINANNNYNIRAGVGNQGRAAASGYFVHDGDLAQVTANASYQDGQYSSLGVSLQGGMTATMQGAALHRINVMGGTRMMVDTDGVAGVPIYGYGGITDTNMFGKAVVGDVNSYYHNAVKVDVDHLADNVEATRSVVEGTLTEGAIGYRRFGIIAGEKSMAVITLADGSTPPFGAIVSNQNQEQLGIVNDEGRIWLTGIQVGEIMNVRWDGAERCRLTIPKSLPSPGGMLLLPCQPLNGH
ncbi:MULTISPECIES: outer membrane usher protein [Edwardsiella]|uniref:Fimbriae usher protein StfC n=2 Tax=Edwardsiella anguillarum TaxID=1821960 RepID=A0A076LJJ8_9GAMM|nr:MULTISPECIES: outer membrane usher protein [Edwardsiella]GAJ66133.1 fimbrial biogenesis outer membrane usher protein [Edwardsiella piscicida]AIJ06758.1 Fimbriae usher protein StfC [Edwardsiella anguillarum ET080813]AKR79426.2 outer membrane usher protein [Edwardsiella sp. LADL05-105]KAB0593365.1 outer membrane usher protein [Edwardsiella anguillarum]RFT02338.1 PapC/FimD family outer membrane usher protein [Edwardsiella anguillarum]